MEYVRGDLVGLGMKLAQECLVPKQFYGVIWDWANVQRAEPVSKTNCKLYLILHLVILLVFIVPFISLYTGHT